MSSGILKALMQLFAIIAREAESDGQSGQGREVVAVFLRRQLNQSLVDEYLQLFDQQVGGAGQKEGKRKAKRTSLSSVKVLRICTAINEELAQKEKYVVLVRLIEFVHALGEVSPGMLDFLQTVADTFNIDRATFDNLFVFCGAEDLVTAQGGEFLHVTATGEGVDGETRSALKDGLLGRFVFLRLESEHMFLVRYQGEEEVQLNGQVIADHRAYVFMQGASLRGMRFTPVYYSDVIRVFLTDTDHTRIRFEALDISFYFERNNKQGLHQLNLREESGSLIGIMGASGSGKSTLLNVLNGNYTPSYGKVSINGIDVHGGAEEIEGLIGYVAQDDLLIEELTVFQNLFYNAKLCFADQNDEEITELVHETLQSLGLYEARDLKVGSPLKKTISGGQRKRLNIALELIREPAVLFVDEPTSGLSSRDSENIMDLLKELTLKGKLIFTVIHQPSSEIFKMFDKLFLLDTGGFPIYYGNPVESIIYFKRLVNHVNAHESECERCGNVNPEQIFNIIESKVVDEYGNLTPHRKISPREWANFFNVLIANQLPEPEPYTEVPKSAFRVPNKVRQLKVFSVRDMLSKLSNRQYMLINMLEAPALALVLSFFIKYFKVGGSATGEYIFRANQNVPQFLFISVIVALFLGLTVSAEEIIRDRTILRREKFLNLSRGSYLTSKIGIMFLISAIQMAAYVLVATWVLEIKGTGFTYWLILFSTSCFANLLGLNVSATFNSAKVIYILIPILIIPQLLFSGVIVKFDKLNPFFASQKGVPMIGNIMASRWAYEALAVNQFKNNAFESRTYEYDARISSWNWKKDVWNKNEMRAVVAELRRLQVEEKPEREEELRQLVLTEFDKEKLEVQGLEVPWLEQVRATGFTTQILSEMDTTLQMLHRYYMKNVNNLDREREKRVQEWCKTPELKAVYRSMENAYTNAQLEEFVTNSSELTSSVIHGGEIIQKKDLVYRTPLHTGFFGAHFYAPSKPLFGKQIPTKSANLMVLWGMTLGLILLLFVNGLSWILIWIQEGTDKLLKLLRLKGEELPPS